MNTNLTPPPPFHFHDVLLISIIFLFLLLLLLLLSFLGIINILIGVYILNKGQINKYNVNNEPVPVQGPPATGVYHF